MRIAKLVKYQVILLFITFMILSTILAMFIDSITVILFLAAVTIELSQLLKFNRDCLTCNLHPTQKPVALLEYFIRTYTNVGDTVLDNCMGSGSTGVAAVNTNRNFIGIELDRRYFEIAEKRLNDHST